jgi:hypothetical protein
MGIMDYDAYLLTEHWKIVSDEAKRLADYRCRLCNAGGELHTHHRTYANLGHEPQGDLIVLCKKCHKKFHNSPAEREKRERIKAEKERREMDSFIKSMQRAAALAMATKRFRYGNDYYKSIEIEWDEDHDERIYEAIDIITNAIGQRSDLISAGEHEGCLALYWKRNRDWDCLEKHGLLNEITLEDDTWCVNHEVSGVVNRL